MSGYARGGYFPGKPGGTVRIELKRGPIREAVDPGILESYADECYLNPQGVCVRRDELHRGVTLPDGERWWTCPLHDQEDS